MLRSPLAAALLATVLTGTPLPAAAQSGVGADDTRRLSERDIVVAVSAAGEGSGGRIVAMLDIPVSQQRLWDIMLDCRSSLRIVENLKSCKVTAVDPDGRWDVREHVVQWGWPLPSVRSVFRSDYAPFERISFRKTAGDLKDLRGIWRLEPLPAGRGTRLRYEATIDPGVPLPGFLVRNAIEADVRKTLAALRREAAQHGGK